MLLRNSWELVDISLDWLDELGVKIRLFSNVFISSNFESFLFLTKISSLIPNLSKYCRANFSSFFNSLLSIVGVNWYGSNWVGNASPSSLLLLKNTMIYLSLINEYLI